MKGCLLPWVVLWPAVSLGQQGSWEQPFDFGPSVNDRIVAVHMVHVFSGTTGKVLVITWDSGTTCESDMTRLWTPPPAGSSPGDFETVANCYNWVVCCGHSALADGRILTAGGVFRLQTGLFNPIEPTPPAPPDFDPNTSPRWNNPAFPPFMDQTRWYPTNTTLPDGRVLISSGWYCDPTHPPPPPQPDPCPDPWVRVPELYTPNLVGGTLTPLPSASRRQPLYPSMFVLPDGNLFDAGAGAVGWEAHILVSSTWTWGPALPDPMWWPGPTPPPPPGYPGAAVMYEPGKVMKCGGQQPAVATTFVVDLNGANPNNPPAWMVTGNMGSARRNHNLVILPDGKVLAVGGNISGQNGGAVYNPEIFDPAAGTWSDQPAMTHPRMYHSTAILLRDGRVVSAGGDSVRTAQIFKPPYMNPGVPRPEILTYQPQMHYGANYTISYTANGGKEPSKACLMRLGAVTHSFDQDQRRVPLAFVTEPTGTHVTLLAPASGKIAPPGYYMLFILSEYALNQYAPSVAAYVQVGP